MEDHINDMLDLVNKLAALGEHLMNHLIVAMMLSSLPDSYNTLITALESRAEEDLTLDLVKGKLIDEYKRRKATGILGESALKISKKSEEKGRGNQECFFCKKHGHQKRDCYKYKKWKQNKEKANQAAEYSRKNDSKSDEVCFYVNAEEKTLNTWFIDSGATSHMTNNKDFFEELNLTRKIDIRLADGKSREACGIGMGKVKCLNDKNQIIEVKVTDVLYVPSLESSLLSVKRLTEKGLQVKFESNKCCITKDGKIVAVADESSNLYKLRVSQQACMAIQKHNKNCQHIWHKRFGHRDPEAVKQLANNGLAVELKITDCGIRTTCRACIKGKMARKPFPKKSENRTSSILDLIHTDLCGPMQTQTPGKNRYILTIIDDYSRYTEVFLLRSKDETTSYIKDYVQKVKTQFNKGPKFIRSDRGKEYINAELRTFLKREGIQVQYTAAYSPQQNGVAERKNRSLMEMARCMIIDAEMPNKYWGEAVVTANYLQNRLPTKATERTPHELWFTKRPNVNQLKIFGCIAFAHIPKEQRRKLDVKAKELKFVGYAENSKAFRLLDITTDRIIISRDVIFIEDIEDGFEITKNENEIQVDIHKAPSEEIKEESTIEELTYNEELTEKPKEKTQDKNADALRRSNRKNKGVPPQRYEETTKLAMEIQDPRTIQEAMSRTDRDKWKTAMDDEINSLNMNNTWELTQLPDDRKQIGCKWVFKLKRDAVGNPSRYKARLVAQGFSQKYGTDYDEVFAPVVRSTTFRTLLVIAGRRNFIVKHIDAKAAFLNGELKEVIYMKQPIGYEVPNKEHMVCKLNKSLYGLKQAAKVWNEKIHKVLEEHRFRQSEADPCLYINVINNVWIYIIVYVDDIIIGSKAEKLVNDTIDTLRRSFDIVNLGNLSNYLGMSIERDNKGIFYLSQPKYIKKIIDSIGLQEAKICNYPLDPGYENIENLEDVMEDSTKYQKLIGELLYVAVHSRPDIAATVSILSQRIKCAKDLDWTEAKRTVRYLKGTIEWKLKLGDDTKEDEESLIGYADANWAQNKADRKSNSGFIFMLNRGTISWACRKQTCVALSTTEAEYIALAEACQEGIWIERLLKDFGIVSTTPLKIYEDNQSCLKLLGAKGFNNRTKHIDTKYHFIKQLKESNIMDFVYCETSDMIADMLTKPLHGIRLKRLAGFSGLQDWSK